MMLPKFINHVDALTVKCDYTYMMYIDEPKGNEDILTQDIYGCSEAKVKSDIFSIKKVVAVSQNHTPGKADKDVELFRNSDNSEKIKFPREIGKFFPNLMVLSLAKAGLVKINSEDLKFLTKLRFLILTANKLTSVESDLFKHTPNLEYLHLGFNSIKSFGHNILYLIPKLKRFYVYNNICMNDDKWTIDDPKKLQKLQKLMNEPCPPDEVIDGSFQVTTVMLLN